VKVSLEWLRRYVEIEETPEVLAHDLTMFGLNVEEIHRNDAPFSGVVYGRVLEVEKHPQADKLSLCLVDVGRGEPLRIVCGASNVRPGIAVPVALHGAVLPDGFKIKRTKIRGEKSEGMICSERELAIGEDADGIMELSFEEQPGVDIGSRLVSGDVILDIEVTPNRPDQLCHLGIAREISALYQRPLAVPEVFSLERDETFRLEIENQKDCPRYSAAFIENVKVQQSPDWMQELLKAVGVKPINNVVDVTNFVLMELGQPLHAFDREKLAKDTIIVRRARKGEYLVTLDGEKRELDGEVLVIADSEHPVALAGVMGGEETEVTDRTTRLLLESAMFESRLIRSARQRFKLETEASYRFEREGDVGITKTALERACFLLEAMGAGEPRSFCRDLVPDPSVLEQTRLPLRVSQANRVMGTHLSASDISTLLERLELESTGFDNSLEVSIPSFRRDLNQEIDLIEEVARLYGYDNIGRDRDAGRGGYVFAVRHESDRSRQSVCDYMSARGFIEVITTSFMDPEDPVRIGWKESDPRRKALPIENPLTAIQSHLRTSLLPGLLHVVKRNPPGEHEGLRLFEMGKVFIPAPNGAGLPTEELHLIALFARKALPLQWLEKQRDFGYFDMKGELEALLEFTGMEMESLSISRAGEEDMGYLFNCFNDKVLLIECGMLSKRVTHRFDVDTPVFYFDLSVEGLQGASGRYRAISPYPAVKRDLCLIANEKVTFGDITKLVKKRAKYLESISLFDYYRDGRIGAGKRSYTFRLGFRSIEGTLDDTAVDREIERILESLKRELQVTLRLE
jgi:phenylalanyl-tRNA synthetase beta chain